MNKDTEQLKGKKADAFSDVPEGYFQQLQANVSRRISDDELHHQKRDLFPRAIAAAFLILLATGTFLLFIIQPVDKTETARLTDSTILQKSGIALNSAINEKEQEINIDLPEIYLKNQLLQTNLNDSTLFQDISIEEMMSYLIEKEEFEF
ncbi:MAG: hypothetical protein Q8J88_03760 [Bacteroidales bacterium]|nr:hypothetical protein [Bacteroidales bacterium]